MNYLDNATAAPTWTTVVAVLVVGLVAAIVAVWKVSR